MVQLVGTTSLGLGKLIDGKNQFVHIRYSAHSNGSNMTTEIQADTKYIGIATNSSETAPTSPSDYSWGRFVGTPGASSYTWIRYSSNADGSNMTTIPNEETKYIGVAVTAEDSAPTDYTRYSWALFKGSDGRGVKKTEVSYQKSTSGTVIPTGAWLASIPSLSDGEYLWTRTLFTYTDGTTTSTYNVSRNGTSGLGIARTDVHYQKSTSGTVAPTGTWTVTIPTVRANEYLWTRTTITYTDDSTSVSYSVGKMGADGKDAQLLYLTASSQIQAFDKDNQPKTTQPITISAKLQNASGTATFTAIPYIGNTAQTPITLGGTGNDRTLLPSQWTDPKWTIIAITATLGSLTDTISVNKVKDGESGETPVVHIAWADSADGSEGFTLELPTNKIPKYRGYYVDYSTVASTDPKKYKWERNPDDTGAEVDKAMTAVESAVANAEEAERLAATASQTATIAKQEASAAQNAASMAQGEVSRIEGVIVGVQGDIDTALQEVADQAADLQATKETLELNYAKKTEVSDVQAALTTEISKKVGELQTTVSQTYAAKNDVVAMEGRLQSQITQTAGEVSSVVGKVDKLEADTTEAQKKVDEALEKSAAAQTAASQAQAYADAADRKVTAAQTDLNEAKQNLVNTINRVDATEADIAEAQLKVESAQAAVAQAQRDAAEAALAASNAQAAADKAQQDVAALTKRVASAETAITQNTEQIRLSATKTEEIGTKLDNLKLSDDNLLEKTDTSVFGKGNWFNNNNGNITLDNNILYQGRPTLKVDFTQNVDGAKNNQYITLKPDTEYYYSIIVKSNKSFSVGNSIPLHIWMHNTTATGNHMEISLDYDPKTVNANEWTTIIRKFKTPKDYDTYYLYVLLYGLSGVIINVADIQVREGSKFIPWSPSSKDGQSQINGINSNLTNNYYSKTQTDAAIKVASDNVTTTVRKEVTTEITNVNNKVDNLQVGSTNLIKNTSNKLQHLERSDWFALADKSNTKNFNLADYPGKRLTLRVWIQNPNVDAKLQLYFNAPGWKAGSIVKAGQSGYSQLTVDVPATLPTYWNLVLGTSNGVGFRLDYKELKAEIGDFATSWSPHPEDTQSQIDNINVGGTNLIRHSAIDVISNDEYDRWWYFTSDGGRYSSSFEQAEQYTSIKTDVSKSGTWGQWQMDNNVLKYTDLLKLNIGDEITIGADVWIDDNTSGGFIGLDFRVNPKTNYDSFFSIRRDISPDTIKNKQWQRLYITGKITQKYIDCINDLQLARVLLIRNTATKNNEVRFRRIKVEMGNKPTPWSPSPGDLGTKDDVQQAQNDANEANSKADATEHRVNIAESTIKQLSDSISMLVTDSNGSSMMTQTSDGWTFNIGAITSAIDSATNNIDNLSGSLSQTNNVVNNLNNLANDLSKKTAYINMTTDETGAPCIELGKTGNAFKVRITNTSVDFIQGSSKIAYVSNQALFIEKAIIKSELQIGEKRGFVWKTRSNGNMGLRWFG